MQTNMCFFQMAKIKKKQQKKAKNRCRPAEARENPRYMQWAFDIPQTGPRARAAAADAMCSLIRAKRCDEGKKKQATAKRQDDEPRLIRVNNKQKYNRAARAKLDPACAASNYNGGPMRE